MFKSFWNEIKYLFRNKWNAAAIILMILLPFCFTFLQVSANWDPFGNSKNIQIAIVNFDNNNTFAQQAVKGVIKTDKDLKFNGTNQKYNLHINQIYLKNPADVQTSLNIGKYDAIYVIPKGYGDNQINSPSNFINNKIEKLSKNLKTPGYLKNNPYVQKVIFNGLDNFIGNMKKQVDKGTALTSNQKALFTLLNFFIRNSRVNTAALKKFTDAGVPESDLKRLDKLLTTITGETYNDTAIPLTNLIQFINNISPVSTFLSRINYANIMTPFLNGILSSLLSTPNNNVVVKNDGTKSVNTKKIQLFLSNQNNAFSSELINMLTHSPNLFSNIYTKDILTKLSTGITNEIRAPLQTLITQILTNTNNFINGNNGIMEILYPGSGVLDTHKIVKGLVKQLFQPLKNPTFLWPFLDKSLADSLRNNIAFFNFNINGFITYKPIGNPNKKFGQIIAPNLMAISMWLALLGFVFISRNKRIKGNKSIGTVKHYLAKLLLYVSVGLTQTILMFIPLILYGVTSGSSIGFLLIYGLIVSIILSAIAEAISFLSKSKISIILCIFILLVALTVAYGLFPISLESSWISWINYLSPTKYVIDGFNYIFNGGSFIQILESVLSLLAFTIIIPIAIIVNIIFDNKNKQMFGKYKDFAYELDED